MNTLIDKFQAKFPPNRLVALAMALLIPTVIAPAAGFLAVWVPAHFPGLPAFTTGQLTAFGVAGASAALLAGVTAGYKYLDGWQRHEHRIGVQALSSADLTARKLDQFHEKELALIEASSNPQEALQALDEFMGHEPDVDPPPAPESPSAAVRATVPPPPRSTSLP